MHELIPLCGKNNADTKGLKSKVSTSHDFSEISIQQFSSGGSFSPPSLDLRIELQVWHNADVFNRIWLLLWLMRCLHTHTKQKETCCWISEGSLSLKNIPRKPTDILPSLTASLLRCRNGCQVLHQQRSSSGW